jgi:serine protease
MKKLIFVLLLIMALITGCSSNSPINTVSNHDVYGTITTEEFGSPIEGVQVSIGDKTDTTDSEGKYSITDIKKGNYVWKITSSKYQDFSYEVNIKSDSKIDQSLALSGGTASVSGSITLYNDTGYTITQSTTKKESQSVSLNTSEDKRKYKKGEVIVKYKGTLSTKSIQNIQNEKNLKRMNSLNTRSGKMIRYEVPTGKSVEEMIKYYQELPKVEWAEPNYLVYQLAIPSDTYYSDQWGLINLNMEAAWDQEKTSDSIIVAVIDSGIVPNHPDLQNNLLQGADFVG